MRLGECDMWQIMFRYTKADKNPLNITTIFTIVRKEKKKTGRFSTQRQMIRYSASAVYHPKSNGCRSIQMERFVCDCLIFILYRQQQLYQQHNKVLS